MPCISRGKRYVNPCHVSACNQYLNLRKRLYDRYTTEPYLSYTVHFVGEDWKLESRCLQTLYLPEDHTGENIAVPLRETLESWEIDVSKQVCLTTDNGSNIVCATESCLGWTHLSCFGHNLHLAVQNSTKNDRKVD